MHKSQDEFLHDLSNIIATASLLIELAQVQLKKSIENKNIKSITFLENATKSFSTIKNMIDEQRKYIEESSENGVD